MAPAALPGLRGAPLARAIQLAGWRLATSTPWRLALVLCGVVSLVWSVAVVVLAVHDQGHEVHNVVRRAAVMNAWIAGGLLGWWAAADRAGVDHVEGYEDLARTHGIEPPVLAWARGIAATARVFVLVLLASVPVVLFAAASSPSFSLGLARFGSVLPLMLFAAVTALCTGGLGSACGVLSRHHGRSLLAALVFVPWALDGLLVPTRAAVGSIPGMLGFLAGLISRMGSVT